MRVYRSKAVLLAGSSYDEVLKSARFEHKKIENMTKRRAYVRSTYFRKDKIFISIFWTHLMQKHRKEQVKRLKLYAVAIDLLRNSRFEPETLVKKDDLGVLLHRFYGVSKDGVEFCVQVKQDKKTGRKDFMSVFDRKNPTNKKPSAL